MSAEDDLKKKADAEAAEAEAKKADAAKADADAGTKLDKILSCIDSLNGRMDAMESDEKKKADAAKADADEKEAKAKADAEEEKRKDGDVEQLAADKAKKDNDDKETKEKADAAKADATKALADAADVAKRIADVEAKLPKAMADADYRALADHQAKADAVFQAHGLHAPRPLDGDTPMSYRKRQAVTLKAHSKVWNGVDVAAIADDAFGIVETQIYADAMAAANNPTDIPEFTLRPVHRVDQSTGMRTTSFYGKGTFIGMMKRPSRRVSNFVTRKDN